jgi:hypothetical protein
MVSVTILPLVVLLFLAMFFRGLFRTLILVMLFPIATATPKGWVPMATKTSTANSRRRPASSLNSCSARRGPQLPDPIGQAPFARDSVGWPMDGKGARQCTSIPV